jgi:hypothetical protein
MPARPWTQHGYHHDRKVKPEVATAVIELLMMGGRKPKTCWAVNKRQDIKLKDCFIWFVIYLNCTMRHGLTNLESVLNMRKGRNSYVEVYRVRKRCQCSLMLQQDVYIITTITAGCEMVKHLPSCYIIATRSKFSVMVVKCIHFLTSQIHDTSSRQNMSPAVYVPF